MSEKTMLLQIGSSALRAPDGSFLPSVPIYIMEEDANSIDTKPEDYYVGDIAQDLAGKYKEYLDGLKKKGLKP